MKQNVGLDGGDGGDGGYSDGPQNNTFQKPAGGKNALDITVVSCTGLHSASLIKIV